MEDSFFDVVEFLKKPSLTETFVDILLCAVPIWLAVMIGLVIGWSWRPRWTGLVFLGLRSKFRFLWTAPPGFGARRLWLAFTALSAFTYWFNFKGKTKAKTQDPSPSQSDTADSNAISLTARSGDMAEEREQDTVTQADLEHFLHLLEGKDEMMDWQSFMERSTPNMQYKAWRHDPETGPTVYCSRTVFDDATPELVRDFFWDDDFRPKWDAMLAYCKVLEECPHNGTMISHWIKKFPFFCSDREYIIARRIWQAGNTYYCVTKGVPYPSLPKRDKPRRVELYFSMESRKGDGQMSACEVTLLHYEDMGIPKDVAKLGVRHGMWGAVKKLHSGMRAYQNARKTEASLSRCALMASKTTKISSDTNMHSSEPASGMEDRVQAMSNTAQKGNGIDWKWVAVGGTVALVLGLHTSAVGRALLLGAGHRIARR
ncbi:StAR-related lipid transfer protein 7, mitochondrial isoform B [Glycine soja]|uniref:StAR-related lipid transfer protein 7, mitochondrial isoform B n=1 Tax=Glycine soja TaxID=3848 RepID=A0A445M7F2_GLYSO|nr:StAR-related lipid transfer protein 7, mitochondrial isoform B [Glycine soja]